MTPDVRRGSFAVINSPARACCARACSRVRKTLASAFGRHSTPPLARRPLGRFYPQAYHSREVILTG